jgi:LPPG:FO 2-phospho-L-lactate transferase
MIRAGGAGPVQNTELRGIEEALPTPEVVDAIAAASVIVIGPSNPVISIGPILTVPEMRQALLDSPAPVVAVSPIVGGDVLKGPTAAFMRWAGRPATTAAVADGYEGLIDGLVADEVVDGLPVLQTDTLMDDPAARRRVAAETLTFAAGRARWRARPTSRTRSCRSSASRCPRRASATSCRAARAARSPRRWSPTCSWRCAAPPPSTRS